MQAGWSAQCERLHRLPRDLSDQVKVLIHGQHREARLLSRGGDQQVWD